MGAPSDILGLGELRPVTVDSTTLSLNSGHAQYQLVAPSSGNVDIIARTSREGQIIMLCGPASNTVTVRDNQIGTNIHLANGSTSRALSQYDTLILRYENGFWIEVAFTNAV
jgi:hypothetical protein